MQRGALIHRLAAGGAAKEKGKAAAAQGILRPAQFLRLIPRMEKTLIDYMKRTGRSAKEIADDMISNGVSVQEITIRGWLDEESHTVRPQKLDSIQQIALIAGDDELFDGAEICFDAGGQIYKLRRQILKVIGQAILGEVTGNGDLTGTMTAAIADRIKDAAVTLQIETITFVNDEVPINTTNRPITIDQ